jgi:ATP-citrate lyase beta-subunit
MWLFGTTLAIVVQFCSLRLQEYVIQDIQNPDFPSFSSTISTDWLKNLFAFFLQNDMTLLEINPLVEVNGELLFLDSKTELDDTAHFRHEEWATQFPPRTLFTREPTENEKRAKEINAMDHRGVAGASYFDFPGTIGILASGGGASTLAMDTLLATSLKPANYTEYSGNPTREKVAALAKLVLEKPSMEGLWIVGGHANFTDIYETLMGVMDGIEQVALPAGFPIVVRRGGPRQEEAFVEFAQRAAARNLAIHTFDSSTPIPDTAFVLESAVQEFRQRKVA